MNSQIHKPPTANRKLLNATVSTSATPMFLTALGHFSPLDSEQIRAKVAKHAPETQYNHDTITLSIDSGCITEKEHFCLMIDQAVLDKSSSLHITSCKHFTIRTSLNHITPSHDNKFFIQITGCEHFTVEGINCSSGRNMLFITASSSFTVQDCLCSNAEGSCVIINNGSNFRVSGCHFDNNLSAGILVIGNSYNGEIQDCTSSRSHGFFNHDAGIHLCQTSPHITSAQIPEKYHEPLPITSKTERPYHIIIKNCIISHCRAQGIYLEGAINCIIEDNTLLHNNKEGICFDWGSCYNIFNGNIVTLNGERRTLSPLEIKIDFIAEYPLLKDGSSSMKLPGISLDNGCMNLITENKITGNYGGGIKMIRTALFNNITNNQLLYNALGANEYVPFFHGITALGIGALSREFKATHQSHLDFMPSILNSITHNTIKESLRAIFYDKISSNNFSSDNTISQPEQSHNHLATACFRIKAYIKRLANNLPRK